MSLTSERPSAAAASPPPGGSPARRPARAAWIVLAQLADPDGWDGATVNVGGGVEGSLSLRETTDLCRELTGNEVAIEPVAEARPGDVPHYASDCRALFARTAWRPARSPRTILEDTLAWIEANEQAVMTALG